MSPFAHPQLLNSAPVQARAEVAPLVAQAAGWTGCRARTSAVLEVKSMLSMLWNMKNGKNWPNPMFVTCLSDLKLYPNFLPLQMSHVALLVGSIPNVVADTPRLAGHISTYWWQSPCRWVLQHARCEMVWVCLGILKKKTQNSSKFGYFEIVYLGLTIISYPSLGSARGVVTL